jgi:hypothetical protein
LITDLVTDYSFAISNTGNVAPTSAAADVYSYAGSPTRYALSMRASRVLTLPAAAFPSTAKGWVAVPVKNEGGAALLNTTNDIVVVKGGISGNRIAAQAGGDGKSLLLFVDSQFKESTVPYDWDDWKYVALQFDMSVSPWSGRIYVDGVAATSLQTDVRAAEVGGSIALEGVAQAGLQGLVGQVIVYDDTTDSGEVPRYVTRVEPNANGSNLGTWTPSVGVDDFAVLDTPLDKTTYTQNTVPAPTNRVEVLTTGGGSDLDTALGTTTTAIDSVMVHGYSTGQSTTVRTLVGDGTASETAGASAVLTPGTITYTPVVANTKPSGGSWAGTDAPEFIFEVVS